MTGVHVAYRIDTSGWDEALRRQIARTENHEPFLKSVGEEMLGRISDRFKGEHDPDGTPWALLAPRTIARRLKKHGKSPITILREYGHLAGSINYRVSRNALTIGTAPNVEVSAGIHQFGGEAGRGHKAIIPARPCLGLGEEEMEILEEEAA